MLVFVQAFDVEYRNAKRMCKNFLEWLSHGGPISFEQSSPKFDARSSVVSDSQSEFLTGFEYTPMCVSSKSGLLPNNAHDSAFSVPGESDNAQITSAMTKDASQPRDERRQFHFHHRYVDMHDNSSTADISLTSKNHNDFSKLFDGSAWATLKVEQPSVIKDHQATFIVFGFDFILTTTLKELQTDFDGILRDSSSVLMDPKPTEASKLVRRCTDIVTQATKIISPLEGILQDFLLNEDKFVASGINLSEDFIEGQLFRVRTTAHESQELMSLIKQKQAMLGFQLSSRRNTLLLMQMKVAMVTISVGVFTFVTGAVGMNLQNPAFSNIPPPPPWFDYTTSKYPQAPFLFLWALGLLIMVVFPLILSARLKRIVK